MALQHAPQTKVYCKNYEDLAKYSRVLFSLKIPFVITPQDHKPANGDFSKVLALEFEGNDIVRNRVQEMYDRCDLYVSR